MTNFKWADVAHYYTKSPIGAMVNGVKRVVTSMDSDGIIYTDEPPSHGQGVTVCPESVEIGEYTPILRHRDDLTEGERNAHFERLAQFYADGLNVPIGWEAHSLISMGVDVFGLIESGEAIRKGVGNG